MACPSFRIKSPKTYDLRTEKSWTKIPRSGFSLFVDAPIGLRYDQLCCYSHANKTVVKSNVTWIIRYFGLCTISELSKIVESFRFRVIGDCLSRERRRNSIILRRNSIDPSNPPLLNFLLYTSHKTYASVRSTHRLSLRGVWREPLTHDHAFHVGESGDLPPNDGEWAICRRRRSAAYDDLPLTTAIDIEEQPHRLISTQLPPLLSLKTTDHQRTTNSNQPPTTNHRSQIIIILIMMLWWSHFSLAC